MGWKRSLFVCMQGIAASSERVCTERGHQRRVVIRRVASGGLKHVPVVLVLLVSCRLTA